MKRLQQWAGTGALELGYYIVSRASAYICCNEHVVFNICLLDIVVNNSSRDEDDRSFVFDDVVSFCRPYDQLYTIETRCIECEERLRIFQA